MPLRPPPEIFKAYDIRGLYGEQIDGDVAELIGRAVARVRARLQGTSGDALRVGLGRDMRLSAPELAARYRQGLLSEGASVVDAGQVGSEMLYFLVGSRELDGGLMCTASHNPKAYTGAKLVREGAIALSGDSGIQDIRREIDVITAGSAPAPPARGSLQEVDIYEPFQEAALGVRQFFDLNQHRRELCHERLQFTVSASAFAPVQIGLDEVQPDLGILGRQLHGPP